jgi:hypothetical protein
MFVHSKLALKYAPAALRSRSLTSKQVLPEPPCSRGGSGRSAPGPLPHAFIAGNALGAVGIHFRSQAQGPRERLEVGICRVGPLLLATATKNFLTSSVS